ncbi:hypothetical protein I4U23_003674 [Adineta vaga]|nr:hypothetical protein I4U23_003674 [Adineta vaga]
MVFRSIVSYFLDKYLGDYIENLDTKKFKLNLWQGDVVLEDLYLKSDILANYNLPVTIKKGHIRKLSLHISWKHLYEHPIKISIDGFYVLAELKVDVKYNAEQEEKRQYNAKMKEVHKVEDFRRRKERMEQEKRSPKNQDTFLNRLWLHIMRNLQISISNIHLAFEDTTTKVDHPFAFGITLNYMKFQTTNSEWEHAAIPIEDSEIVYKFAALNALSIYWNSNIKTKFSEENLIDELHAQIMRNDGAIIENMTYVLRPSNIEAKLQITSVPSQQNFVRPILDIKIDFGQIYFDVNRDQYTDLLDLFEHWDYIKLRSKYIKYYETIETDQPNIKRWKFAYTAIVNEFVRPHLSYQQWENIRDNLHRRREYHTLYFKKRNGQATKQDKEHLREIEKQLDVLNIVFIRRNVDLEVKKEKIERKEESTWDWLSNWWTNNSNDDHLSNGILFLFNIYYDSYFAIHDKETAQSPSYPEEYVDMDLSIQLELLEINVWSSLNENDSKFDLITQIDVSNTNVKYQRHPTTLGFLAIIDIDELEIYGVDKENIRPNLLQRADKSEVSPQQLLHVEFETNPVHTNIDYRIHSQLQSVEIIYDAMTMNGLIDCFYPGVYRDLKGVKKKIYSMYMDIRHRIQFLLDYNIRNIKNLDLDIDFQSVSFLVPENGIYQSNNSSIACFNSGHLMIQGGRDEIDKIDEEIFEDAQSRLDVIDSSYIPIKIRLEDIHLLYAQSNEDWQNLRNDRNSPIYFIKPYIIDLNIDKCIYVDDPILPLWKLIVNVSTVDCCLLDKRIFGMMKLIRSIPISQVQNVSKSSYSIEELFEAEGTMPEKHTKKLFETIENMAKVKENLQQSDLEAEPTELEGNLNMPYINILFQESISNKIQPFVRISLVSFTAQTTIKTFHITLNASLSDFTIIHEQFLTNNNEPLRLLSTTDKENLLTMNCLLTSPENPLFYSAPYNRIENKVHVNISKPIAMLQIDALVSIIQFRNDLMNRILKLPRHNRIQTDESSSTEKSKYISSKATSNIVIDLEQFRIIMGTDLSQLLDIQFHGLTLNITQSIKKFGTKFLLTDFHIFDLHAHTRYRNLMCQQSPDIQVLYIDFITYNHPKFYKRKLKDIDYKIKIYLNKINTVFLYKYIDIIVNSFNAFQSKQLNVSTNQTNTFDDMVEKFHKENSKIYFDIIVNIPTIFIPIDTHSNEGIFIDVGELNFQMQTREDHPNQLSIERQELTFRNFYISHRILNDSNEISNDIVLVKCTEFHAWIHRVLYLDGSLTQPEVSAKIEWETIDITLTNEDYSCIMKIFERNFSEQVFLHSLEQEVIVDKPSTDIPVEKHKNTFNKTISKKIQIDFEIQKINLTLCLNENNQTIDQLNPNKTSEFLKMIIEMIDLHFQQLSDGSYTTKTQIKHVFLDDLYGTRVLNRNFHVDPNVPLLITTIDFQSDIRHVNIVLESFYLWLTADCLMALKLFFTSIQSSDDEDQSQVSTNNSLAIRENLPPPAKCISVCRRQSLRSAPTSSSPEKIISSNTVTKVDILIKTPQICWLEDQSNSNSNCLVFNFAFQLQMNFEHGETQLHSSMKNISVYSSNFLELKDSKIIYHILQPMNIDIISRMNSMDQCIDVNIKSIHINLSPSVIQLIVNLMNSIDNSQTTSFVTDVDKKVKVQSTSLFDPKPFKDASFWFLTGAEIEQEMVEQRDILEMATGTPTQKKDSNEENEEDDKPKQTNEIHRSQKLKFDMKLVEMRLELGSKSIVALCLSNLCLDVKNWSNDINFSSRIHIELAVFNDHMLAWIPLIEPVVDKRGEIVSPWYIICSTQTNKNEYPIEDKRLKRSQKESCLGRRQNSLSTIEEHSKDITDCLNAKKKFHIRAENLLNITLTKSSFDLIERLTTVFMKAYNNKLSKDDDIEDKSILSVHNLTGYEVLLDDIKDMEIDEMPIKLKYKDSIAMKVPKERLSSTHLPDIDDQIIKRQQEFSVQLKINNEKTKVDVKHTSKRVYPLSSSSIPNWPIELHCDSHIHNNQRRVILSSIVKIYNRTTFPLFILDVDSIETKNHRTLCRLDANDECYLPIEPLYMRSSSRLFISVDENDFISFDWRNETILDRRLKMKNDVEIHLVILKETIKAFSENTDESSRSCFHIYINLALHLINLLPIDVQCSIDRNKPIDLKPSELYNSISGTKQSILTFIIPSYKNIKWLSEPVDLTEKGHGNRNEHLILFHGFESQDELTMILRVDIYQESFRAALYSPFWIINCTNLKLEFKIDNEETLIDVCNTPFLVCPKKIDSDVYNKKAHLRVHGVDEHDCISHWSKEFTLYVVASTGIANCKMSNDRTYMICVHITTTSFCMSKIIKLSSSMAIINRSIMDLEVSELITETEQNNWHLIKSEQIIPFWPHNIKDGAMRIRYVKNRTASSLLFPMYDRHRTLLRMNDADYPAIHVEVTIIETLGIHIIFSDYQSGDAPLLLLNCLRNHSILYGQEEDDRQTHVLPSQHYVYYTWSNIFKSRKLTVSCNEQDITLELRSVYGCLESSNGDRIFYVIFHDGPQTILIFAEEISIIKSVLNLANEEGSSNEIMDQYIDISFHDISLSIINDITHEDLVYITINKSKQIWTETQKSLIKPLSNKLNRQLEKKYRVHLKQHRMNSNNDTELERKTFHIGGHRRASFIENTAEIIDQNDSRIQIHRQALDGLWIRWSWSKTNTVYHLRINHIQIDNQLEYTLLPVVLRPMTSSSVEQPFIELSASKIINTRSKTMYFKYFKLTCQESLICIDQGLINAFLIFIDTEKKSTKLTIDMSHDLKAIQKTFETLVEKQSIETKIFFDCIHFSPLKIHISLSPNGIKPDIFILADYPSIEYFVQILDYVKVHDIILKLDFYEREKDRFTINKLIDEIYEHYFEQLWKQVYVVILGHDLLGNPFGMVREVAHGVKSFFHEPFKGAMEGPLGFIEGVAIGTEHLIGSAVGSAAGASSKLTYVISKGLATLTFDKEYANVRNQRKKLKTQTASDIVDGGRNLAKDFVHSVKDIVKKPIAGVKEEGASGLMKGLGKGLLGAVARPTSSVAHLTSTSCDVLKRKATHAEIVHRTRRSRHIGSDYIIRPSTVDEMKGRFIFNRLDNSKFIKTDDYIAHMICYENNEFGCFLVTSKHILFVKEKISTSDDYEVEWHFQYKELKGLPMVKFDSNQIVINLKEPTLRRRVNRHREHEKIITYENMSEARYIVDQITEIMQSMEL